jgi:wyosine [tRNA(Phe)-imidazoG37] synthetase (radical SAM superfamily)
VILQLKWVNIKTMSKHVFGPVPSRRLGFSLGVDPIPRKYCNFDCIYCQLGKTEERASERKSFFDPEEIVADVLQALAGPKPVDVITFSGSGEPTLSRDLGRMIRQVKRASHVPIAVITNSSLLWRDDVREEIMPADLVLPSLDAVSEEVFRLLNRPHPSISVHDVIRGLRSFGKTYAGKIWLEIMFVKGLNDTDQELERLRETLGEISPDKIQLNTVTRPAHDRSAEPLTEEQLGRIGLLLGARCETISGFDKRAEALGPEHASGGILSIFDRRSLTVDDVAKLTGVSREEAAEKLSRLEQEKVLTAVRQGDTLFYVKRGSLD